MDIMRQIAIQVPIILVSITLLIAAAMKGGREKGATMIVLGAIGMCAMSIATPVIYSVIMPRLIDALEFDDMSNAYLVFGLAVNILWAVPILLIAIGTFQRPPAAAQNRPYHTYPVQQSTPPPL